MTEKTNPEFEAFQQVHDALSGLDADAQSRVISSVSTLLGIGLPSVSVANQNSPTVEREGPASDEEKSTSLSADFSEFAELYAATDPHSNADKALLAGYWRQVCQGEENFSGQSVNTELNHLGHKIANVTNALSQLNDAKPQLVLQLRKSGKSQQARKTYKLSAAGINRVKDMISAA